MGTMTEAQEFVGRLTGTVPTKRCGCTTAGAQGCVYGGDETDPCACKCHYENRRAGARR